MYRNENLTYLLDSLAGLDVFDSECGEFDVAVNDDQFAECSIINLATRSSERIKELELQNAELEAYIEDAERKEWVSVSDKYPPVATWVMIVADSEGVRDKLVTMAFYEESVCDDGVERYWLTHNDNDNGSEWEGVTHWKPKPSVPTF